MFLTDILCPAGARRHETCCMSFSADLGREAQEGEMQTRAKLIRVIDKNPTASFPGQSDLL